MLEITWHLNSLTVYIFTFAVNNDFKRWERFPCIEITTKYHLQCFMLKREFVACCGRNYVVGRTKNESVTACTLRSTAKGSAALERPGLTFRGRNLVRFCRNFQAYSFLRNTNRRKLFSELGVREACLTQSLTSFCAYFVLRVCSTGLLPSRIWETLQDFADPLSPPDRCF
jgi:hypothetical protein